MREATYCTARRRLDDEDCPCVCVCSALLEERMDSVYKADPRYSDKATSMFNLDLGPPEVSATQAGGWRAAQLHGLVRAGLIRADRPSDNSRWAIESQQMGHQGQLVQQHL